MKLVTLALSLLIGLNVSAHEGHNHDAPTTIRAPKGGQIKALDESRVEVVAKGKNIKIFFYDKDLKSLPTSDFEVKASVRLPKKKTAETLELMTAENNLEADYDSKGSHRYTLKLEVTHLKTKMTDSLNFQIEPKK